MEIDVEWENLGKIVDVLNEAGIKWRTVFCIKMKLDGKIVYAHPGDTIVIDKKGLRINQKAGKTKKHGES